MKHFILLSLSIWIWTSSCNDPVLVGSGLLDEDTLDVAFVDTMKVSAKTVQGEKSITFRYLESSDFPNQTYMVGHTEDNVFGKSEAVTYFTPELIADYPELTMDNLDSVVLSIPFSSDGFYGDNDATHDLELRMLAMFPDLDFDDTLFSDIVLDTEATVFASRSLKINPSDSVTIKGYSTDNPDSLLTLSPELRMPLDKQFWADLNAPGDTLTREDLRERVPGFELRSTPSTNSMFGLDLRYTEQDTAASINFYYNLNDSTKVIYYMPIGRVRHSTFTHDYSGSDLDSAIDVDDNPLLYLQSQAGTNIAVDISDIRNYDDQILNSATMELTVVPEDEALYTPVEAFFAYSRNEDGAISALAIQSEPVEETFPDGERKLSYTVDITQHLNQVKKGLVTNDTLFLIAGSKAERPNRSIILGTDDLDNPLHIDLILTKP